MEDETWLNYILPKYNDVVVCTYDLTRFSARVVIDVLRTHPGVIIGDILQLNPFFVPPDEFVRELQARVEPAAQRDSHCACLKRLWSKPVWDSARHSPTRS